MYLLSTVNTYLFQVIMIDIQVVIMMIIGGIKRYVK